MASSFTPYSTSSGSDHNPPFEGEGSQAIPRSVAGKSLFSTSRNNLSIAPGVQVQLPFFVDLHRFTHFTVHYFTNAAVEVDVYWKPSIEDAYVYERTLNLPANIGGGNVGNMFSGTTKSRFMTIEFTNDDVVPLTDLKASIYASSA